MAYTFHHPSAGNGGHHRRRDRPSRRVRPERKMSESPDTESLDAEAAAVQNIAELRGSLRAQPDDFGTRIDLAAALPDQDGAADGLDEAVGLLRAAVASAIDVPQWSVALDMLAAALAWRFWQR